MPTSSDYKQIVVESFRLSSTSGHHGEIHVRPVRGQPFASNLLVECSRRLIRDFPVGTRFRITAKLVEKDNGTKFIYSYHRWPFEIEEAA